MKDSIKKLGKYLPKILPVVAIAFLVLAFFWKAIFLGKIPLPSDIVVGAYYPWLDYKWGYDVGVPIKNPITSDVVSVIFPLRSLAADMIKGGNFPLWNPYMFAGYPLFANFQAAVLSPTTIFYLLLPKMWAWTIQVMLQPFIAALFTYLLLRNFKLSKLASLFGGIVFAFSGFNIIWLEWNAHTLASSFIPLILLSIDKYIKNDNKKWLSLLSIVIALQIFSGYPQVFYYTAILSSIYIFFNKKVLNVRKAAFLFSSFILGVLITAIQTVPAFELLSFSQRRLETLSFDLAYLPWQNIITFVSPDFFGNHATANFWGIGNYTNNVGYTGVIPLALSIISIINIRKRIVMYFFLLIIVSLLIALPFPWTRFLTNLGLLGGQAASNVRALVIFNFSVACLSAFGIQKLTIFRQKVNIFSSYFLGSLVLILMLIVKSSFAQKVFAMSDEADLNVAFRNLILPLSLTISLSTLLILRNRFINSSIQKISIFLIIALCVFELFRFGWKYTPFSEASFVYPETPVTNFLKEREKPFRIITDGTFSPNMWMPYKFESLPAYDAYYPLRIAKLLSVIDSGDVESSPKGRFGTIENLDSRLLDLTNGEYFLTIQSDEDFKTLKDIESLNEVFKDKSSTVYRNESSLPRAFFVSDWIVEENENEILNILLDDDFPLSKKIILEKNFSGFKANKESSGAIEYLSYSENEYVLKTKVVTNGFIFITDTWYPGWSAYVNGQKTSILRADYTFRAVPVKKGDSIIRLSYEPFSFKIGIVVSGLALLMVIRYYLNE